MLTEPAACATDGRWKLVRDTLGERAYDLARDRNGVAALPVDRLPGEVRSRLAAALDEPTVMPAAAPLPPTESADVDLEALEAQLKLLGYL
jgi:hypothetical protein